MGTLRTALEACGVAKFLRTASLDDIDRDRFDSLHREWCTSVVDALKPRHPDVTFGRAAKLIAVYLKSAVVLGSGPGTAFARVAHPPADSILLGNLARSGVISPHKGVWARTKWTQLTEERYYELIAQLRQILAPDEPFWTLERFWTVTEESGVG